MVERAPISSTVVRSGVLATTNIVSLVFLLGTLLESRVVGMLILARFPFLTRAVAPPGETDPLRSLRGELPFTLSLDNGGRSGGVEKLMSNSVPAFPFDLSVDQPPEMTVSTIGIARGEAIVLLNVKPDGGMGMDLIIKHAQEHILVWLFLHSEHGCIPLVQERGKIVVLHAQGLEHTNIVHSNVGSGHVKMPVYHPEKLPSLHETIILRHFALSE